MWLTEVEGSLKREPSSCHRTPTGTCLAGKDGDFSNLRRLPVREAAGRIPPRTGLAGGLEEDRLVERAIDTRPTPTVADHRVSPPVAHPGEGQAQPLPAPTATNPTIGRISDLWSRYPSGTCQTQPPASLISKRGDPPS
jgi:hypothetical protein